MSLVRRAEMDSVRLSDRSTLVAPRWPGRAASGRFIFLSVNNQTAEKSSAVKCGRGHCGEQFMKGIVGASLPPTQWSSRPTGGGGGA